MTMLISAVQELRSRELQLELLRKHPHAKRIDVWWKVNADFTVTLHHQIVY